MESEKRPEIFFHVGLERTATTFMQRSIFPKFKDIYYIPKNQYKNADFIISSTQANKYLISFEFFSEVLMDEMRKFAQKYPNTNIIIVLRRQDKWIASHFKRHIKMGYDKSFEEYIDIFKNQGRRKKESLYFYPLLKELESYFTNKPLVLFRQDLVHDPEKFLKQILKYTGVQETKPISFTPRHTSYDNKELWVRQWFARKTPLREIPIRNTKFKNIRRFYNKTLRYLILYSAKLIPGFLISDKPLISKEYQEQIRDYYKEDWEKCLQYAQENNP